MSHTLPAPTLQAAAPALLAPFPASDVGFIAVDSDGTTAQIAVHPVLDAVHDRLDTVLGLGWQFAIRSLDEEHAIGRLEIDGVVRESVASGVSAARREASGLKRAAQRFGCGRYLARMQRIPAPIGAGNSDVHQADDRRLFIPVALEQQLRDSYSATVETALRPLYGPALGRRAPAWEGENEPPATRELSEAARMCAAPFLPEAIVFICVESYTREGKTLGVVAPVVQRVSVEDRLDVVDPRWSVTLAPAGPGMLRARLTVLGITKEALGEGETRAAQEAQALKRAAKQFGIGRYLARDDLNLCRTYEVGTGPDGLIAADTPYALPRVSEALASSLRGDYADILVARLSAEYGDPLDHHDELGQPGDEDEPTAPVAATAVLPAGGSGVAVNAGELANVVALPVRADEPAPEPEASEPPAAEDESAEPPAAEDQSAEPPAADAEAPASEAAPAEEDEPAPATDLAPADASAGEGEEAEPPADADMAASAMPPTAPDEALPEPIVKAAEQLGYPDGVLRRALHIMFRTPADVPIAWDSSRVASTMTLIETLVHGGLTADEVSAIADQAVQKGALAEQSQELCNGVLSACAGRQSDAPAGVGQQTAAPDPAAEASASDNTGAASDQEQQGLGAALDAAGYSDQDAQPVFALVSDNDEATRETLTGWQAQQATAIVAHAATLQWSTERLNQVLGALRGREDITGAEHRCGALIGYQQSQISSAGVGAA